MTTIQTLLKKFSPEEHKALRAYIARQVRRQCQQQAAQAYAQRERVTLPKPYEALDFRQIREV